jgi:hypothetical protein
MKVRYTPEAFSDRERILEYLRERSPGGAPPDGVPTIQATSGHGAMANAAGTAFNVEKLLPS